MATAPHHLPSLASLNREVSDWVDEVARLTRPDRIHWCDGSDAEFHAWNANWWPARNCCRSTRPAFPGCYLYRSDPSDVARVEHLTFVCTAIARMPGPTITGWRRREAHTRWMHLFAGCMQGRTLYVVPYCMGPIDSPFSRCGVEITDSAYVVLNMKLMTRMGRAALERIARDGKLRQGTAFDRRA